MKKHFYVCSYSGSGSKMLCSALNKYKIREFYNNYIKVNKK